MNRLNKTESAVFLHLYCRFSLFLKDPLFLDYSVACEQQRGISACVSKQSDQHLCYLLYGKYTCNI